MSAKRELTPARKRLEGAKYVVDGHLIACGGLHLLPSPQRLAFYRRYAREHERGTPNETRFAEDIGAAVNDAALAAKGIPADTLKRYREARAQARLFRVVDNARFARPAPPVRPILATARPTGRAPRPRRVASSATGCRSPGSSSTGDDEPDIDALPGFLPASLRWVHHERRRIGARRAAA